MTPAASSVTPYQPSMTVSVVFIAMPPSWLPTSGTPSTSVARAWLDQLIGAGAEPNVLDTVLIARLYARPRMLPSQFL